MSQIETIMLVALGFAVAALIALFLGRFAWVFALSLGKKRMQRSTPTTIAELQSDRDRLRAEYAMLSRRLELRMSELKSKLAEQMAEVSRNRNRIDHLISELRARDKQLHERDTELQSLRVQLGPLEQELTARTASVQQLKEHLRSRDEEVQKLAQTLEKLRTEMTERNRQIAAMKKDIADREAMGALLHPDSLSAQTRLKKRIEDLTSLSQQIETQRRHLVHQKIELASLKSEISTDTLPDAAFSDMGEVRTGNGTAHALTTLDESNRDLEQQLNAAERETAELENELRKLDQTFNARLAELNFGIDNAAKLSGTFPAGADGMLAMTDEASGPESEATESISESTDTAAAQFDSEPVTAPDAPDLEPESQPVLAQTSRTLRSVANVISLAARTRSQQKKTGE
jgi:DNA repair exonuclease SbcCD ATPase subunit